MKPEQFAAILSDVSTGTPTWRACEAQRIHRPDFYKFIGEDKDAANRYARAKQDGLDAMADELQTISDACDERNEAVAKARLQIDTRKWLLAKLAPKKYGERQAVEHTGTINVTVTAEDAGVV